VTALTGLFVDRVHVTVAYIATEYDTNSRNG
jgi:hypothetical protein